MSNHISVRPIAVVLAEARREMEEHIERARKCFEAKVKSIEEHRRLLPMLDAEGVPLHISEWNDLSDIRIDLGLRPETKRGRAEFAKKLAAIRRVLECPLKYQSKSLSDARKKLVRMYLGCKEYPNITVTYTTKLPKDAKCRVVRKKVRYTDHQLVCEI